MNKSNIHNSIYTPKYKNITLFEYQNPNKLTWFPLNTTITFNLLLQLLLQNKKRKKYFKLYFVLFYLLNISHLSLNKWNRTVDKLIRTPEIKLNCICMLIKMYELQIIKSILSASFILFWNFEITNLPFLAALAIFAGSRVWLKKWRVKI